jgi:hypothetical protein
MRLRRNADSSPLIRVLVLQMGDGPTDAVSPSHMAAVLLTGIERIITVATDASFPFLVAHSREADAPPPDLEDFVQDLLQAEARVLQLAIADRRVAARRASAA